jgi:diguanylate cyclase (GGDEF)-like protein/PAS domain S-box-containing protein
LSTRRLTAYYAGWMIALASVYFVATYTLPALKPFSWGLLTLTSIVAVVYGTLHHRPRRRLPWALLAAAMLAFAIGDFLYSYVTDVLRQPDPFPWIGDAFYLAMYPLLIAGVLLLPRSATGRDRAGLVDALVLTSAVALLAWIFLIRPFLGHPELGGLGQAISIAYPLFDILVLATAMRLVTASRRTWVVAGLAVGSLGLLVSDVIYGLVQLTGGWATGGPVDIGWFIFYLAWGAAALDPSMVTITEPRIVRESELTRLRLAMLALSALVAPAALLVEQLNGEVSDGHVIAAMSTVMFLLVLMRLWGVVTVHRQALARERALREAGAALVSATDADAVRRAVRAAVGDLLPAGAGHRLQLTIRADGDPVALGPPVKPRLVRTGELDPATAAALEGFDLALVHPLVLSDRPSGDPLVGVLLVAADDATLVALRAAVEVLASQAALAIERITLSSEILRRNSEEYFRTLVHNTSDVILIVGDDDRVRYASPSADTVFGGAGVLHRQLRELVHPPDRELAHQVLDAVRKGHDGSAIADWRVPGADGGLVEVEVSCRDLRLDPTVRGLVVTLRDVTESRRLERELTHRANHDSLTGLANRLLFSDRVQEAVGRAARGGGIVGVLFVDLDDFKVVNDTLGHETGDQLLIAVGRKLSAALRANDTAARLGGDEFAVLIENTLDPQAVEQVAERLVKTLAEPILLDGSVVSTSASIGVATTVDAAGGVDLLRQADLALYVAKGAGKGRWRRYQSALHTAMMERLELRASLDRAVADGAFALVYQPIVAIRDARVVGLEALVRWKHSARGLILPGDFIEVAEDSGLIVPIGNWVLESALADTARWAQAPQADGVYLSVNVSARQFRAPGFLDKIRRELDITGLPPGRLMLEITESLLMRDEQVWSDLAALRERGVRVAIDDFGTGYSSLAYLRQVPIDVVKIDKSFIDTMATSAQQRALVEGILRLAETLGLQVIAEGIENEADRDLLVEIGCPLGQGYFFASPLRQDDVLPWLRAAVPAPVGAPVVPAPRRDGSGVLA